MRDFFVFGDSPIFARGNPYILYLLLFFSIFISTFAILKDREKKHMKKFLFFIIGVLMSLSLTSCVAAYGAVDSTTGDVDYEIVITNGQPYYYNGAIVYYLYNGWYYYPYWYDNRPYLRPYHRPFAYGHRLPPMRPRHGDIGRGHHHHPGTGAHHPRPHRPGGVGWHRPHNPGVGSGGHRPHNPGVGGSRPHSPRVGGTRPHTPSRSGVSPRPSSPRMGGSPRVGRPSSTRSGGGGGGHFGHRR